MLLIGKFKDSVYMLDFEIILTILGPILESWTAETITLELLILDLDLMDETLDYSFFKIKAFSFVSWFFEQ